MGPFCNASVGAEQRRNFKLLIKKDIFSLGMRRAYITLQTSGLFAMRGLGAAAVALQ
jgi:hypothetical protein